MMSSFGLSSETDSSFSGSFQGVQAVHNLARVKLSSIQSVLLSLGANFIPDSSLSFCDAPRVRSAVTRCLWLLHCRWKHGNGSACPRFRPESQAPEKRSFLSTSLLPVKQNVLRMERTIISRLEHTLMTRYNLRTNLPIALRAQLS